METENKVIEEKIKKDDNKSFKESFFELARFALIAIAIVLPVRLFIIEPFVV